MNIVKIKAKTAVYPEEIPVEVEFNMTFDQVSDAITAWVDENGLSVCVTKIEVLSK
jgi:hypothetical protein